LNGTGCAVAAVRRGGKAEKTEEADGEERRKKGTERGTGTGGVLVGARSRGKHRADGLSVGSLQDWTGK
jgi:hypothetical protein